MVRGSAENGAAPIVGKGENRWATVHTDDLGQLFALAAESGLKEEIFNATDGSRSAVREMASAASSAAGEKDGKVNELDGVEAEKRYGGMRHGLALDQHVDSRKALRRLGWNPRLRGIFRTTRPVTTPPGWRREGRNCYIPRNMNDDSTAEEGGKRIRFLPRTDSPPSSKPRPPRTPIPRSRRAIRSTPSC